MDCHHKYTDGSYESAAQYTAKLFSAVVEAVLADYPDTAIIITGDHGEDLMQHGINMHSGGLWETLVHIPLLVLRPQAKTERRWHRLTQHPQLFGTILDMTGTEASPGSNSQGLYPLQRREALYFDSEGKYPRAGMCRQLGFVSEQYKYWKRIAPNGQVKEYFYHLPTDPGESSNLVDQIEPTLIHGLIPTVIGKIGVALGKSTHMAKYLEALSEARRKMDSAFPEAGYTEGEAKEVLERLRSLGYVP